MAYKIAVLAGDGIGPEVMEVAIDVLKALESKMKIAFVFKEALIGGAAYQVYEDHFPKETQKICEDSEAILFGAVGGPVQEQQEPKWKNCETHSILALRKHFNFVTNIRPVKLFPQLATACVLRPEIAKKGIDILCVRELSEDIYFGHKEIKEEEGQRVARDEMFYKEKTIEKIAVRAFEFARMRRRKVTSVDKANVLACGKLWREVVTEVSKRYKDCDLEHLLVDNATMQLMLNPSKFDVLLCPNMFGDILSDEISILGGSLGMLASASINDQGFALYEPPGGSANDIAGEDIANPIGQILSAALMLKYSFKEYEAHARIIKAVHSTLDIGYRTRDIAGGKTAVRRVSTQEMGEAIIKFL